jgi:hypothetical protein
LRRRFGRLCVCAKLWKSSNIVNLASAMEFFTPLTSRRCHISYI